MAEYLAKHGCPDFILSATIILFYYITPANARQRSFAQFQEFFPAWDGLLKEQLKNIALSPSMIIGIGLVLYHDLVIW